MADYWVVLTVECSEVQTVGYLVEYSVANLVAQTARQWAVCSAVVTAGCWAVNLVDCSAVTKAVHLASQTVVRLVECLDARLVA